MKFQKQETQSERDPRATRELIQIDPMDNKNWSKKWYTVTDLVKKRKATLAAAWSILNYGAAWVEKSSMSFFTGVHSSHATSHLKQHTFPLARHKMRVHSEWDSFDSGIRHTVLIHRIEARCAKVGPYPSQFQPNLTEVLGQVSVIRKQIDS